MTAPDFKYSEVKELDLLPFDWALSENPEVLNYVRRHFPGKLNDHENVGIYFEPKEKAFWKEILPTLTTVKYLSVGPRFTQDCLDSICEMTWLERLQIEFSSIRSIESISSLTELTHLHIGSSPQLSNLSPISELKNLKSLGLQGKFTKLTGLEDVARITSLEGLALCGQDYFVQQFETLKPLAKLKNLAYLSLVQVKAKDKSLKPVANLKKLRYLTISKPSYWSKSGYQYIDQNLPELNSKTIAAAAHDIEFQKQNRIK